MCVRFNGLLGRFTGFAGDKGGGADSRGYFATHCDGGKKQHNNCCFAYLTLVQKKNDCYTFKPPIV